MKQDLLDTIHSRYTTHDVRRRVNSKKISKIIKQYKAWFNDFRFNGRGAWIKYQVRWGWRIF